MASRHLARSLAMQALYEWDFWHGQDVSLDAILEQTILEFGPGLDDTEFVKKLVSSVVEKIPEIDTIIKHAAPEWPIEKIAIVDRNILRIGLWELLFGNYKDVPPKVAINESIELAKTFGGENSGRFINGVLGTVYRELGEPGKDETSKKYNPDELAKMPVEKRGGAIVLREPRVGSPADEMIALVHDVFGYWTLPKGKIAPEEGDEDGSKKAVTRELGIANLTFEKKICENEYVAHDPEKGAVRRRVVYYLGSTPDVELHLKSTGGLDDAKWFARREIEKLRMYDDIKEIFKKV